jgi:hypothetical protein
MARFAGGAYLARGLALLVCLACVLGIARLAREPVAGPVASFGDCVAAGRAEIEALKATGRLTAEQAMLRRQKLAAACR